MTRRIIDLTLTMENANAWIQFPRRFLSNHEAEEPATRILEFYNRQQGDQWWSIYRFETTTQSFTHMSSPKHFYRDTGLPIDQFPLDQLIGEAVVLDLSYKKPREVITAEDLDNTQAEVRPQDIVLLRSDWTDKAWGTREFFQDMIGLSADGAAWLIDKKIKALASDCRTDIAPFNVCSECGNLVKAPSQDNNRVKFLHSNIVTVDFCTNLGAIEKPRVFFVALPLKLKDADGSPVRAIAIQDD